MLTGAGLVWQAAGPARLSASSSGGQPSSIDLGAFVSTYCTSCHNDRTRTGGVSLSDAKLADPVAHPELWEKVLHKISTGQMPPANMQHPEAGDLRNVIAHITAALDRAAAARPDPGRVGAHRLNRTEYGNAVRDLLGVTIGTNALLLPDEADYPNAVVADWNLVTESHPEYFVSDQVHLSVSGQRALVDGILRVGAFSAEDFTQRAPGPRVIPWTPAPDAPPLHKLKKPRALDSFWDLMARCETGSNWKDPGQFAGGLGIYVGTWRMFGGLEFAGHPTEASREQQIEIANRVSTQGWQKSEDNFVEPVGFSGWGCLKVTGAPALVEHLPSSIAAQKFEWGHSGPVVRDLQRILGLRADGVYGTDTWTAHLQYLKTHGLSIDLAPK